MKNQQNKRKKEKTKLNLDWVIQYWRLHPLIVRVYIAEEKP
jgi:hypothetical protein